MTLKTILVCVTTKETVEDLMAVAVPLARAHGAHLIGLHTLEALVVYPGIAMHVPGSVYSQFNESQKAVASDLQHIFESHTKAEDFVSEWRVLQTGSLTASDCMIDSARGADLVIMAQEERRWDRADHAHAQDRVIQNSGRPVIVVPNGYRGPEIGNHLLLGWGNTREATRASRDLLTLARPGAQATVLSIDAHVQEELKDAPANAIAEMLSRHGLLVTVAHKQSHNNSVAETLNQHAFEIGADVIVTGAFGHSKAYDFVLGAATYELLRNSKLPVMFSK